MLDDVNTIKQRDSHDVLATAAGIFAQAKLDITVENADNDGREIRNIMVAGMGGSALAADVLKVLLGRTIGVSFEVVKGYELPHYASESTLVVLSSHSGNTEETLSCYEEAVHRRCQIGIVSSGGKLAEKATERACAHVILPHDTQPRMAMIANLRALLHIFMTFGFPVQDMIDDMTECVSWLGEETARWESDVPTDRNYAKQLALMAVGKTPVFYGGPLTAPIAYKWKISWNENAKNLAFYNQYPEFNHNEFMGWTSHPVDKPFEVFDIVSNKELLRIHQRMELSDKLLSGKRPKATQIRLMGDTMLQQALWGSILADFVSIYVAILNGVDPEPVELIERFKKELAKE